MYILIENIRLFRVIFEREREREGKIIDKIILKRCVTLLKLEGKEIFLVRSESYESSEKLHDM